MSANGGPVRGLTLLEMMVALLIAAMATTLLTQAMRQLAGVEQLLERSGSAGQTVLVRREWVRVLLASALPEQVNEPTAFLGDAQRLQLKSAVGLAGGGSVTDSVQLQLDYEPRTQAGSLRLAQGPGAEPVTLLRWTGAAPSFQYQDDDGRWLKAWPPQAVAERPRRPPQRVLVDLDESVGGPLWVSVLDNERSRPRLRDWVD